MTWRECLGLVRRAKARTGMAGKAWSVSMGHGVAGIGRAGMERQEENASGLARDGRILDAA
jgi:hypothetical protein